MFWCNSTIHGEPSNKNVAMLEDGTIYGEPRKKNSVMLQDDTAQTMDFF